MVLRLHLPSFMQMQNQGSAEVKGVPPAPQQHQANPRMPSRRLSRTIQIVKKEQSAFEGRFLSRDAYRWANQLRIQPATARAR